MEKHKLDRAIELADQIEKTKDVVQHLQIAAQEAVTFRLRGYFERQSADDSWKVVRSIDIPLPLIVDLLRDWKKLLASLQDEFDKL